MMIRQNHVGRASGTGCPYFSGLSFQLGDDVCAVDCAHVREVVERGELIVVPRMPPLLRGAIKWHGTLVPILDLHPVLGGTALRVGSSTRIVIVAQWAAGEASLAGLLVDAVSDALELAWARVEPWPSQAPNSAPGVARGRIRRDQGDVILLDLDWVFAQDDLGWFDTGLGDASNAATCPAPSTWRH